MQKLNVAPFTGYQKFLIAVLAFLQFTIILDFMIISPLGAMLMPALHITPSQFGVVVSAYAFSAAASGILAAGFADRFDRKKFLLFFYCGFLIGTALCAMATSFQFLLMARIVTGIFGGVIGSVVLAITTDLFAFEVRGRVIGFIQAAFAASQVLGIPLGIFFSNHWGWHAPFVMIVVLGSAVGVVIFTQLQPIDGHLKLQTDNGNALSHLLKTLVNRNYTVAFALTALLSTGGYMLMPFGSAFTVNNMDIDMAHLPVIYLVSGIAAFFTGPLVGRAADTFGKVNVFVFGALLSIVMVMIYTHLGPTPLWLAILVNSVLFVGIFSRIIPAQALTSAIPAPANRGAFMAVNASLQQMSGGLASVLAGIIVTELPGGKLDHFDKIGYVVVVTTAVSMVFMFQVNRRVMAAGVATTPAQMPAH
jgi:predicted MFS family arabinose efflux permease